MLLDWNLKEEYPIFHLVRWKVNYKGAAKLHHIPTFNPIDMEIQRDEWGQRNNSAAALVIVGADSAVLLSSLVGGLKWWKWLLGKYCVAEPYGTEAIGRKLIYDCWEGFKRFTTLLTGREVADIALILYLLASKLVTASAPQNLKTF